VSVKRGNDLQNQLAKYLRAWWPHAESAGAGRNGRDVLGTPGVAFENKTAVDFKRDFRPKAWVAQARLNASQPDVPVVVYWPPGVGERSADQAMCILPMDQLMRLLEGAGYAPPRAAPDAPARHAETVSRLLQEQQ
jgi:hypothetical protein